MKIDFPHITKPINLAEYAAEMSGTVWVWVNPPRSMLIGIADQDSTKTLSTLWSQHPDTSTHWTEDEVKDMVAHSGETDPRFFSWLVDKTGALLREHRDAVKKA